MHALQGNSARHARDPPVAAVCPSLEMIRFRYRTSEFKAPLQPPAFFLRHHINCSSHACSSFHPDSSLASAVDATGGGGAEASSQRGVSNQARRSERVRIKKMMN